MAAPSLATIPETEMGLLCNVKFNAGGRHMMKGYLAGLCAALVTATAFAVALRYEDWRSYSFVWASHARVYAELCHSPFHDNSISQL